MNTYMPDEILREIFTHIVIRELIPLNLICWQFKKIIKGTCWKYHPIRNIRYLIKGYSSVECEITYDEQMAKYNHREYNDFLENLGKCSRVLLIDFNIDPSMLTHLTHVSKLELKRCRFVPSMVEYTTPSNIRSVELIKCFGKGFTLKTFSDVQIDRLKIRDIDESELEYLANVNILELSVHAIITDRKLEYFGTVNELYIYYGDGVTDYGLQFLSRVKKLCLFFCSNVTDAGLIHLTNVIDLNLTGCDKITNEGLRHLSNVQKLNVMVCPDVTADGFAHLKCIKSIQIGEFGNCSYIYDDDLVHFTDVDEIYISECSNITDHGLWYLRNVTKLELINCTGITGSGFKYLKKIRDINLLKCNHITEGLEYLDGMEIRTSPPNSYYLNIRAIGIPNSRRKN